MIDAIVERLPRVLRVEGPVHGEIAADESATAQAILVTAVAAAISSLTGGEGNFIVNVVGGCPGPAGSSTLPFSSSFIIEPMRYCFSMFTKSLL